MVKRINVAALVFLLFAFAVSCIDKQKDCSGNGDQTQKTINPNGDSELALLMREMYDESLTIKQKVSNNEQITVNVDHAKILTAHATEPEKASSSEYRAFANAYLHNLNQLQSATPDRIGDFYDVMIENCMSCHRAMCPGPMVKIKKLRRNITN